jgi:hypothetical protein
MRTSKIAIGMARPRLRVVQALVRGFLRVRTRVRPPAARQRVDLDRLDPDQRVREVGEW